MCVTSATGAPGSCAANRPKIGFRLLAIPRLRDGTPRPARKDDDAEK
jgi:hypothetical protein